MQRQVVLVDAGLLDERIEDRREDEHIGRQVHNHMAKNIAKGFVNGKYDGGRHQIWVDMLNKMC